jgi:hypothetical protein
MKRIIFGLLALGFLVARAGTAEAGLTLVHDYELNNTFSDSLGGPSLVPDGGTLSGAGYSFARGQGLSLDNAISNPSVYGISVTFAFSANSGWNKIIDPHNLGPDIGLYVSPSRHLNYYYESSDGSFTFAPNQIVTVLQTRDAAGTINGYVNGSLQWSFHDTSNLGVITAPNNRLWFFEDDAATGHAETSAGFVTQIKIFAPTAIPEPNTLVVAAGGVAFSVLVSRLRRRPTTR